MEELELERTCSTNQRPFFLFPSSIHFLLFRSLLRFTTAASISLSLSLSPPSNNYNIASLLNHFARHNTRPILSPRKKKKETFHRFSFLSSLFQVCIGLDSPVDTHRSGGRRRFENGEQPRRPGKRLSVTRLHGKWFSRIPRFVTFLRLHRSSLGHGQNHDDDNIANIYRDTRIYLYTERNSYGME